MDGDLTLRLGRQPQRATKQKRAILCCMLGHIAGPYCAVCRALMNKPARVSQGVPARPPTCLHSNHELEHVHIIIIVCKNRQIGSANKLSDNSKPPTQKKAAFMR